jgi:Spy/CpxP family protein refolding chaperone
MFDSNSRARRYTLGALLCVAAATVSACAHSQQAPPADSSSPRGQGSGQGSQMRRRGGGYGDRMFEGMNLTNDQRAQITLIRDRYRLQADSMRIGGVAHDSTGRAAFRSLMTREMSEIRSVLTPDQQKQFDDRMAKMRERHAKHGGRDGQDDHDGHNGAPPAPDSSGGNPPPPSA